MWIRKRDMGNTDNRTGDRVNELRGSYTVEAAAVVSLTFLVLGALIMTVFFAHDRAVIQSAVCEAAAAGSNFITPKERETAAAAVRESITQKRLLGSRGVELVTGIGEKTVQSSGAASFPVPGAFANYLSGGNLSIHCEWSSSILDPADVIWKIRGARMVLDNLIQE